MTKKSTSAAAAVYLPPVTKLEGLQKMSAAVAAAGLEGAPTCVGGPIGEWLDTLTKGTEAWVYSLDLFGSITELMARNQTLAKRGIALRSISEPWFNDPKLSGRQALIELFRLGEQIHSTQAPRRPVGRPQKHPKAAATPKRSATSKSDPERIARAVELRRTQNLSVTRACQLAGCSIVAYYNHLKKQRSTQ